MKSVNMAGFGYSMFSEKMKISVGGKTISIGKSNSERKQGMFGVSTTRRSQKENSDNGRLSAILIKFNAGKKLTAEELAYLRQKQPETYMKVQQVMMEREMLERRMKQAKTKEQTAAAYMAAVSSAMPKGTGGSSGAGGASVDAAKINQLSDAHRIYTASSHYKAKIDQSDIAKEEKLKREEMAGKMDEQQAKLEESMEKQELLREELSIAQEEKASEKTENKIEDAKDVLEEVERLKKASRRKRKKVTASRKKASSGTSATFHFNPMSEAEMREKLRELLFEKEHTKSSGFKQSGNSLKAETDAGLDTDLSSGSATTGIAGTSGATNSVSTGILSTSVSGVGSAIDISL